MKYKLAIFDMDGTILDTLDDLKDSINYALRKSGFPERTLDEVRSFVGNGLRKLVERAVPNNTDEKRIVEVYNELTAYYKLHCTDKTKPYDGIHSVLKFLKEKGVKTAVVSNKADFAVQQLCIRYFDGLFDVAVGEKEDVRKKPYPDSVNMILEKLRIKREDSVYIGDSEVDIFTAENAGMNCISVDWGFRDRELLKANGAKSIVSDMNGLLSSI